jgi:hypothetical protein
MRELELSELTTDEYQAKMADTIDLASDQAEGTWLLYEGKRIAAVVPVDVAEWHEQMVANVLHAPLNGPRGDVRP